MYIGTYELSLTLVFILHYATIIYLYETNEKVPMYEKQNISP